VAVQIKSGEILALVGMGLLLLTKMGRRRVQQGRASRGLAKWVPWGDFLAFGLILAGLVVMYLQK
jgi:hypothetical protein